MKIKLKPKEIFLLEVFILDKLESNKANKVKKKLLNNDIDNDIHLYDDEYLFLLTCCEEKMTDEIIPVYESLIKQDMKNLVKPIDINFPII